MIAYFVHSTSVDNEQGRRSGWSDSPLSKLGEQQARELRELVRGRTSGVYCSDLRRAVETVRIAFDCEPQQTALLREINYGELNGHPPEDFPEDPYGCISESFPGGESCRDVETRVVQFLADTDALNQDIFVVAHRYTQLALSVITGGISWREAMDRDWRKAGAWQPGWEYQPRQEFGR